MEEGRNRERGQCEEGKKRQRGPLVWRWGQEKREGAEWWAGKRLEDSGEEGRKDEICIVTGGNRKG